MARTRVIGAQFWKYKIAGFLQWGYNFYNSQGSVLQREITARNGDLAIALDDTDQDVAA